MAIQPQTNATEGIALVTNKNSERVLARIRRASQIEQHQRFLIYGKSGAGKTRLSATTPSPLLIDINERGTSSVRKDLDPYVFPVELWTDLTDIYWYLASGEHTYQSVVLDGVTAMQNLCMKFVLGDERARDASRDPDMPSRQVWGKVGELMKTQITNYRNLPLNVVFTALTRTRASGEDDEDLETVTGPACSPSIAGHLEAAVDTIGYLTTREVSVKKRGEEKATKVIRRRLITGVSERYVTKDRNNAFGMYVDNPDLTAMIESIYKEEQ